MRGAEAAEKSGAIECSALSRRQWNALRTQGLFSLSPLRFSSFSVTKWLAFGHPGLFLLRSPGRSLLSFSGDGVAEGANATDFDFDAVAVFHVGGGALGAHPDYVAGDQGQAACHADEVIDHAEDHVVGGEFD